MSTTTTTPTVSPTVPEAEAIAEAMLAGRWTRRIDNLDSISVAAFNEGKLSHVAYIDRATGNLFVGSYTAGAETVYTSFDAGKALTLFGAVI